MDEILATLKRWVGSDAQRAFYERYCPEAVKKVAFEIRPMKKKDLKAVAAIEESAYPFPWPVEIFKSCLKVGYSCWVGEMGDEVIAYGILSVGAGEAHVMNICVSPRWQGAGYGQRMMECLIQAAKEKRADMVLLEVRPSNEAAVNLYYRLGFNDIGRRKDYYPAEAGKREDALVLARTL
ncbi:ribosomal protein S18-alanine N-acetyltransferase [Methylohalobius crimeensis]|uniref:ribosomal protein S18-alanine N-acetyltransferase n=1 Tax=Methylohalobius crimeensis TaxID=244365 RepID=UPI0003B48AE9|nr:ribosomal protein S18-alanine N-acetyltransferase [Methylohalobius crimeensis]